MKVLITGAGGFAGRHLIAHLQTAQPDAELYGTLYDAGAHRALPPNVTYTRLDLRDVDAVHHLIDTVRPAVIYHLAAQSSPSRAIRQAWQTLQINIRSQLNIISACCELDLNPRLIAVTSGEIYDATSGIVPQTETMRLLPANPYALSKITQDMMGLQYYLSHQLSIIRVRPFNHTGPGQRESFVAPDFAMQIARIEAGLQAPQMHVGNLSAERDFTDVRDVVRAYALLAQHGISGEAYNVASNRAISIQYLLDTLLSLTDIAIDVRVDPDKLRPVDVPTKYGSNAKLRDATNWTPTIPFEQTLADLLNDCRQRIQEKTKE